MSFTIDGEAGTFTKDTDEIKLSDDALTIPSGNTAQRPQSPIAGMIRFNTDIAKIEGYSGRHWANIEP